MSTPRLRSIAAAVPAGLVVDLARSPAERQRALELHRDVYAREGLLLHEAGNPRVLPQACAPGSAIFIAKEHTIVGTITFYMDSPIGLPMDEVHGEEVAQMRARFERVAEIGGLAVLEDSRGLGVTMLLYRAALRWALATRADCLVACVNPSCRRVYTKMLPFHVLGACRQHVRFLAAPSIPIGLDLAAALARYEHEPLRGFFGDDVRARRASAHLDSARYLQWSDDEVLEMIRTEQLVLDGDDHRFIERYYGSHVARNDSP